MKKRYLTIMMATMVASTLLFGCGNASSSADNSDYFGNASDEAVADDANGDAASEETEEAQDARKTVEYNSCFDSLLANALIIDAEYLTLTSDDQVIATYGEPSSSPEATLSDHQYAYYDLSAADYPGLEGLTVCLRIRDGESLNYYHLSSLEDNYNNLIDYMKEEGKWNMPIEYIEPIWDVSGERDAAYDEFYSNIYNKREAGKITEEEFKEAISQYWQDNGFLRNYNECVEAFGSEGYFFAIDDGYFKVAWYIPETDIEEYKRYGDEIIIFCFDPETGSRCDREGWGRR